jgi:hypothetical protein
VHSQVPERAAEPGQADHGHDDRVPRRRDQAGAAEAAEPGQQQDREQVADEPDAHLRVVPVHASPDLPDAAR